MIETSVSSIVLLFRISHSCTISSTSLVSFVVSTRSMPAKTDKKWTNVVIPIPAGLLNDIGDIFSDDIVVKSWFRLRFELVLVEIVESSCTKSNSSNCKSLHLLLLCFSSFSFFDVDISKFIYFQNPPMNRISCQFKGLLGTSKDDINVIHNPPTTEFSSLFVSTSSFSSNKVLLNLVSK